MKSLQRAAGEKCWVSGSVGYRYGSGTLRSEHPGSDCECDELRDDIVGPISSISFTGNIGGWVGIARCSFAQASAAPVKVVRERERDHRLGGDGNTKACDPLRL